MHEAWLQDAAPWQCRQSARRCRRACRADRSGARPPTRHVSTPCGRARANASVALPLVGCPIMDAQAPLSPFADGLFASRWPGDDRDTSSATLPDACTALLGAGPDSGAGISLPAPATPDAVGRDDSLPARALAAHGTGIVEEARCDSARPSELAGPAAAGPPPHPRRPNAPVVNRPLAARNGDGVQPLSGTTQGRAADRRQVRKACVRQELGKYPRQDSNL